ncbi:MAG: D-alanine--D-alanine ligase [Bacteriovoracaceae bacterium]
MKTEKTQVLLLCGGGSTEHEVSLVSSNRLKDSLSKSGSFDSLTVEIGKDGLWRSNGVVGELNFKQEFVFGKDKFKVDIVIPCIHGFPAETGDLQSMLELLKIPYIGCKSEASLLCFNKVSTKLWLNALGVPNTPFIFLNDQNPSSIKKAQTFFAQYGKVFIKASSQGSSVGVYPASTIEELNLNIEKAFRFSPYILIEKAVRGRELEVSIYEFQGQLHVSYPGEIVCPDKFYSYEEKYSDNSATNTHIKAPSLSEKNVQLLQSFAKQAFLGLKLRHLSRIDFFLEGEDILLNEINTFPGLTPISMFPKMLESNGHNFDEFLREIIKLTLEEKN